MGWAGLLLAAIDTGTGTACEPMSVPMRMPMNANAQATHSENDDGEACPGLTTAAPRVQPMEPSEPTPLGQRWQAKPCATSLKGNCEKRVFVRVVRVLRCTFERQGAFGSSEPRQSRRRICDANRNRRVDRRREHSTTTQQD